MHLLRKKTLVLGIDVGSETHYVRAFDWRNYEFSDKPLAFSNDEAGFLTFMAWVEDIKEKAGKTAVIPGMEPTGHYWFNLGKFLQGQRNETGSCESAPCKKSKEMDDNNPDKNDRKDPKTIAALVNEGRFFLSLYSNRGLCRNPKLFQSAFSDTGRDYQDPEPDRTMDQHLFPLNIKTFTGNWMQ